MTFKRPQSVWLPPELDKKAKELHARMAVYIDHYMYKPQKERDDLLIYQYIYHITYMLACKRKMFQTARDYDMYALYSAGKVYGRIINQKQFITESGQEPMKKITSILNYIKASLLGMKVSYQREEFQMVYDPNLGFDSTSYELAVKDSIKKDYTNQYIIEDTIDMFKKIPSITRKVVKSTPYSSDPIMFRRLYISCLLSFLNSITLTNKEKEKISKKESSGKNIDEIKYQYIDNKTDNSVILWRLDNKLYNYVDILVKRVKAKAADELGEVRNYYEMPDDVLTQIMNSPLGDYSHHSQEDI